MEEIESLQAILQWFELMSGLKINYDKFEMVGVRTVASMLAAMAAAFGCKVGQLPIKYLGLPLCVGILQHKLCDSVVERIERKLSFRKGKYVLW